MPNSRRTRRDFFDAAFELLEDSGFPALTASALCGRRQPRVVLPPLRYLRVVRGRVSG